MLDRTRQLWDKQRNSVGDRVPLFSAVAAATDADSVLYPGSYVDLTPSFIWRSVTYVDVDKRAARFFGDTDGIEELLAENGAPADHSHAFVHADYRDHFDVPDASVDLVISLYAGFISEHCTRYLKVGGTLLVNSSHGDAAMASIDERYQLCGVVNSRGGSYTVSSSDLDSYLVPKKPIEITADHLHQTGRGVGYTKSPFAYLFRRTA